MGRAVSTPVSGSLNKTDGLGWGGGGGGVGGGGGGGACSSDTALLDSGDVTSPIGGSMHDP